MRCLTMLAGGSRLNANDIDMQVMEIRIVLL